ncbi:MAG: adenylate kinase [Ruminococcaceae bacterium]|nr:adenylate kinase [Oscillospiraceae bacterium]
MKMILLGAPGAGKGTQADFIKEKLGIPSISTGNLLRAAIAAGSELGRKAAAFMESGNLVPDELVLDLVKERIGQPDCANGMIFDGFPRTVEQADALSKMVDIDMALLLDVPDEVIVNRMSGRRTCPNCQTTYHVVSAPPKVEGVCDKCGAKLGIRKDDKPEVVRERLAVYHSKTEPIVEYYRNKGVLKVVDGQASLEQTRALVAEAIGVEL